MDQTSQSKLDEILKKEHAALTEGDKAFLRSRVSYLTEDHKARYAEVFGEPDQDPGEEVDASEEKPKKKGK